MTPLNFSCRLAPNIWSEAPPVASSALRGACNFRHSKSGFKLIISRAEHWQQIAEYGAWASRLVAHGIHLEPVILRLDQKRGRDRASRLGQHRRERDSDRERERRRERHTERERERPRHRKVTAFPTRHRKVIAPKGDSFLDPAPKGDSFQSPCQAMFLNPEMLIWFRILRLTRRPKHGRRGR